ncbi:hypothetical protein TanjilG_12281 [Lupinus angustifolius]|uniref:Peptidase S49 domain-containing protein n=1 Tax=Lupinus angustifolius TaxID=3871 RepID=A0A1J7IRQ2_LUPAN|nr:hypothetical protein TanjilG_12281 [Lupinus angustifolius]
MSKLLLLPSTPHLTSFQRSHSLSFSSSIPFQSQFSHTLPRHLSLRAFNSSSSSSFSDPKSKEEENILGKGEEEENGINNKSDEDYPSGEFEFEPITGWRNFLVKLKMLVALPWERVRKGSVLTMKLRGQISDQVKSRFSPGLSLPQICENFLKAAYDPRISGIYLHIDSLNCGWGKVEEIRRHILNFKKSGKFVVAYVPTCQEKEYYLACACEEIYAPPSAYFSLFGLTVQASFLRGVLENIGIEPQVERIGKYKSAGDQLARTTMSEENCEMLTALLDSIYTNWLDKVSSAKVARVTVHVLQVIALLKERLGVKIDKNLPMVDYRKYSRVRKWTVGISGGKDLIAIIRASGSISRVDSQFSVSSSGIIAEKFIEKIRSVRESKKYKAAIIRIDSPGGDALASDLMWREIRLLAASKPVIASMSDVAASGGYYMAMAAEAIVAESLTLTGSIGVVTGKFNLGKLYEKIGFNKETISRGRYAELFAAEQRPFRIGLLPLKDRAIDTKRKERGISWLESASAERKGEKKAENLLNVDKMEEVAQGRVWTGKDAASGGLVDAIGGLSRAIAIAKSKAKIPQDRKVTLVEISRPSPSLPEILFGVGNTFAGVDRTLKELLQGLTFSDGVQARMDGIMFQTLEGYPNANPILLIIKDYLSSL